MSAHSHSLGKVVFALLLLTTANCDPKKLGQQGEKKADSNAGPAHGAVVAPTSSTIQTPAPFSAEASDLANFLKANYTKTDYKIPMRDGVHLYTAVYTPKDHSHPHPMMMLRTPYGIGSYGVDVYPNGQPRAMARIAPSADFLRSGHIIALQDVRGRMMSEGQFVNVRPVLNRTPQATLPTDLTGHSHPAKPANSQNPNLSASNNSQTASIETDESSDTYDSIDWLIKNVPNNNGRIGLWGISYPGFYAAQGAINAHPALKAVSPQAPVTDWFIGDDFHHNGAFCLADSFSFFSNFGKPRPEPTTKSTWGYDYGTDDLYAFFLRMGPLENANKKHLKNEIPFWNEMMEHGTRDAFWKARDPLPHYKDLTPASLVVGGLLDAEDLWGAIHTYQAIEKQSRSKNYLVLGPWSHGGWSRSDGASLGDANFSSKTSIWYREKIEFPFFEKHLRESKKQDSTKGELPEATVFSTGTNEWHQFDTWPPKTVVSKDIYLLPNGALGSAQPSEQDLASDEYISDPAKPVPYQANLESERGSRYMVDDQRFAAMRPDVLVYSSEKIKSDFTLAGPIDVTLWVSTTGTDADWVVKIIDVYPDEYRGTDNNTTNRSMGGYQQLIRAEIMRGKFRNSFETPEPFTPSQPTKVTFTLPDILHAFRMGHKLMIQIQSSWFPLFDRNPQTFVDIYHASEADFQRATHKIYRSSSHPSHITVGLLNGQIN